MGNWCTVMINHKYSYSYFIHLLWLILTHICFKNLIIRIFLINTLGYLLCRNLIKNFGFIVSDLTALQFLLLIKSVYLRYNTCNMIRGCI